MNSKFKFLSIILVCLSTLLILSACDYAESEREITVIDMGPGDIAWPQTFESLVNRRTHIMRVEVLDSRVEREEDPGFMPREQIVERQIALRGDNERTHRMIEENFPPDMDDWTYRPEFRIITIYRVKVLEIFRELSVFHENQVEIGEIIEVVRYGGLYGNEYWDFRGATLDIGTEYILLLNRHWRYSHTFDLGPFFSAHYVPEEIVESGDYLVEYEDTTLEIESAGWNFPFDFTIGDLIELAEENDLLNH